jgi:hypothetical protein
VEPDSRFVIAIPGGLKFSPNLPMQPRRREALLDARMWGTVTDVSLHGCYVEMNTTFPAGTEVDLVLKSFGIRIETPGTVRASYPFLGMGICFAEMEPVQQMQLKQFARRTGRAQCRLQRDVG